MAPSCRPPGTGKAAQLGGHLGFLLVEPVRVAVARGEAADALGQGVEVVTQ